MDSSRPDNWPIGYPISFEKAKELVNGSLGSVYRGIALRCSAPLFWFRPSERPANILHNGTVTLVRTPKRTFGITAAHVVEQYEQDASVAGVNLQLGADLIAGIKLIDRSGERDLATCEIEEDLIEKQGLDPLSWPPKSPTEGRGLVLAGYPASFMRETRDWEIEWGSFCALTTARTVTADQISVLISREEWVNNSLPINCNLGGTSGGPIIGLFELDGGVAFHRLSGIITEHPDYVGSDFSVERIVGSVAEVITESGRIY
jgi:hypothetical protein